MLDLSLRAGTQHSASETEYLLERVLPLARRLTSAPLLARLDCGFDSARLYADAADTQPETHEDARSLATCRGADTARTPGTT